jgi:hypothetical protein
MTSAPNRTPAAVEPAARPQPQPATEPARERDMPTIVTNHGPLTDPEFESVAMQFFCRDTALYDLPAPTQVARLLRCYQVKDSQRDWADAVARRALAKLLVADRR